MESSKDLVSVGKESIVRDDKISLAFCFTSPLREVLHRIYLPCVLTYDS